MFSSKRMFKIDMTDVILQVKCIALRASSKLPSAANYNREYDTENKVDHC